MTNLQQLALHMYRRASTYRAVLHEAQHCSLPKRWQREIWTAKENCMIDATILAPELFEFWDDDRYPEMVCVACRLNGTRMHFPKRKAHLLRCVHEA
jgi:hypothetical protein